MMQFEYPSMNQKECRSMEDINKALKENNRFLYRTIENLIEHERLLQKQIDDLKGDK